MKTIIKKTIFKFANTSLVSSSLKRRSEGAKVLFYHGVEKKIKNAFVQSLHIPFEDFEKQINFLKNEYDIISLDEIHTSYNKGYNLNGKQVAITFDDGYKNNFEVVFPFLDSLDIPFSIFISTNHIETGKRFPTFMLRAGLIENKASSIELKSTGKSYSINSQENFAKSHREIAKVIKTSPQELVDNIIHEIYESLPDEQWNEIYEKYQSDEPMSWEDVIALHNSGVEIGSHCHDHFINNQNQKLKNISDQFTRSKELIEEKCGHCNYFCFPNGGPNDISNDAYSEGKKNYELCFSTIPGELNSQSDKSYLPRYGAVSDFEHFKFNMTTSFLRNRIYSKNYENFIATRS